MPSDLDDEALLGWGLAKVSWQIMRDQIGEVLAHRNAALPQEQRFAYEQIFHFRYSDGARMLTTGGVLFDEGQRSTIAMCDFGRLEFARRAENALTIKIPKLTLRELRALERQLPLAGGSEIDHGSMPRAEALKYVAIYRYFPNLSVVEL